MSYTTNPLSVATAASVPPEFLRLPKTKERDPIFGMSRSSLNELIIPCPENDYRPPVRSVVLRKRGARTGIRLIDIESLRAYLNRNVEPAYQPDTPAPPAKPPRSGDSAAGGNGSAGEP
jgi:hypothetical protein